MENVNCLRCRFRHEDAAASIDKDKLAKLICPNCGAKMDGGEE